MGKSFTFNAKCSYSKWVPILPEGAKMPLVKVLNPLETLLPQGHVQSSKTKEVSILFVTCG